MSTGSSEHKQIPAARVARSYAKWLARARPVDYLIALSSAPASLPLIGRHVAPLGGMTALGIWGAQYLPDVVSTKVKARLSRGSAGRRRQERAQTNDLVATALQDIVSAAELAKPWPSPHRIA